VLRPASSQSASIAPAVAVAAAIRGSCHASSAVAAVCSTEERKRSSASHPDTSASSAAPAPSSSQVSSASRGRCCSVVAIHDAPAQDTFDRYGRLLAYVYLVSNGHRSQTEQPQAGLAKVYVYAGGPFALVDSFRRSEAHARGAKRGVWGLCDGSFRAGLNVVSPRALRLGGRRHRSA
jgi:Staphylococcal nuclease homologue